MSDPDALRILIALGDEFVSDDGAISVRKMGENMAAAWNAQYWGDCLDCHERNFLAQFPDSSDRTEWRTSEDPPRSVGASASNIPLFGIEDAVQFVLSHMQAHPGAPAPSTP